MAEGKRNAAVCIGVGQAGKQLKYLQGAVNAARAFHAWAAALGYDARLITDETEPLTMTRLRKEFDGLLATTPGAPIHRLVIYFAGHGLIREVEEGLWLLSDWDVELRAVAVEGLRRRLYLYGIKQIAIFADACRSLPPDIQASDLAPDPVLGRGPVKATTSPEVDRFISAQDGSETYTVPGDEPEQDRCIFSGVLLEGLWGTKPAAFSELLPNRITSQSLASYLRSEVPQIAGRYKLTLNPNVIPTFSNGEDIYFGGGPQLTPPVFPEWPPPEKVLARMGPVPEISAGRDIGRLNLEIRRLNLDIDSSDLGTVIRGFAGSGKSNLSHELLRQKFSAAPKAKAGKGNPMPALPERLRLQRQTPGFEARSGFVTQGTPVRDVWGPPGTLAEPYGEPNGWRIGGAPGLPLEPVTPLCFEFANGLLFWATALPNFVASILCDGRGVSGLVYRFIYSPPKSVNSTEQALAALESGALRADAAADFAVQLRQYKHADPVLGVISAYLYDAIGDIDNIRRMAGYYVANGQPIPYDIALLAQVDAAWRESLPWVTIPAVARREPRTDMERRFKWTHEATPERSGVVGGLWPWMRQGWTFLDDGSDLVTPGLVDLRQHLQPARFTTFDAAGAQKLIKHFALIKCAREPASTPGSGKPSTPKSAAMMAEGMSPKSPAKRQEASRRHPLQSAKSAQAKSNTESKTAK